MSTKLSPTTCVRLILDARDSQHEEILEARDVLMSFFISRDGFRKPEIFATQELIPYYNKLVEFSKHPITWNMNNPTNPEAA
jgi:hypothetical protein